MASAVPTSAVPTSAVPTSAVPTSAVPTSVVPTSVVPTSAVPTSAARLNIKSNNNSITANDIKAAPSSILSDTVNYPNVNVQYTNDHNALGIAALFSVFSKTAKLGADVNGNIAVQNLIDPNRDFGTRENNYNLTKGDLSYIQNIFNDQTLNDRAFRADNSVAILGEFIKIIKNAANQIEINNGRVSTLNDDNTFQDVTGNKYIDFDKYFATLYDKSTLYSATAQSEGVITNFSDMNNQLVDVSNADQTQQFIYVDIDYSKLSGPQPITIKGLSNDLGGQTVIFNVKNLPKSDISVQTQINYKYVNGISVGSNGEDHIQPNHIVWNFGTTDANININSGRLLGSVLAPKATINVGVNIDGNIVGANVNITGGETHRWDVQTPSSEVPSSETPSSETPS
ncbi:collagen-binding domain-containing protein, partial [Leuconostoc inhae]|uniref:collagen-binding domain-containing protein n=1 Tax=Leuconostoc inhae TaxID=178001 RepID=UPI002989F1B5